MPSTTVLLFHTLCTCKNVQCEFNQHVCTLPLWKIQNWLQLPVKDTLEQTKSRCLPVCEMALTEVVVLFVSALHAIGAFLASGMQCFLANLLGGMPKVGEAKAKKPPILFYTQHTHLLHIYICTSWACNTFILSHPCIHMLHVTFPSTFMLQKPPYGLQQHQ